VVHRGWLAVLVPGALLLGACSTVGGTRPTVATPPAARVAGAVPPPLTPGPSGLGDPERGRLLVVEKGCAGCHTVAGVAEARGVAGPVLNNVVLRSTIAGQVPTSPDNMVRWLLDPPAMKPDTTMPKLGLTEAEARDLAAFLYSQPNNAGPR
jgi:cytochrome c